MRSFHPIAIVGLGGLFPNAPDPESLWKNIAGGKDAAAEPPEGRWLIPLEEAYDPRTAAPDKVRSRRQCLIRGFELDPSGLDLDKAFLDGLDPMFHFALHAGREALRSADLRGTDPARTGVILGNIALPTESASRLALELLGRSYEEKVLGPRPDSPWSRSAAPVNRFVAGLPAGLAAKALGLGGGAFTLDAACASSLYAVAFACEELASGRADAMLTGGLSRPDALYTQMGFSQLRAISPSGTCSPFDAAADGLVVGEGAGLFVLKRLEDAFADGDRIHGVIRGAGLSNDVAGALLAPSSEGQIRAMRAAYERAGWSPGDVDLVECHATGTAVGDAVELESLKELWKGVPWKKGQCVIGGVKSNVGHLLTGAGAAGLMKTVLALRHRTLPPTANFSEPNPKLGLDDSPFRVLRRKESWKGRGNRVPRRAGVSAFGFGGINAHLLIEEWDPAAGRGAAKAPKREVSGRSAVPGGAAPETAVPVAIVGMGAHFGAWSDLGLFRERTLGAGEDHQPSAPRWRGAQDCAWFKDEGFSEEDFLGHYVRDLDIPLKRFRIPPNELKSMLPQQLLMLKAAGEALRDAGWTRKLRLRCGAFIGIGLDLNTTNFHLRWAVKRRAGEWGRSLGLEGPALEDWCARACDGAAPPLTADRTVGALGGIVASRIAREFELGGSSVTVQSEESSGLKALERAVRSLQSGELDSALAGAADLAGDLRAVLCSHHDRPLGSVLPGEGAAAVVLKRLEDAVRDGDRVYAVVRGIGSASGGGADSKTPTPEAYVSALERAYREAGAPPDRVGYLEVNGSGIPAEDRTEAEGLRGFFKGPGLRFGTAKAEVGHAGAASGLASVVKAALALHHQILPPLREDAVPQLRKEFPALKRPEHWLRDREHGPRLAGVSSMSVDGGCVHAVLEAFEAETAKRELQPLGARDHALFPVRAADASGLQARLDRLNVLRLRREGAGIERLARVWARETAGPGTLGLGIVAKDSASLDAAIIRAKAALATAPDTALDGPDVFYRPRPLGPKARTAFVFPGSGNQFPGMGRELALHWPEALRRQDAENRFLRSQYLPEVFWDDDRGAEPSAQDQIFGQVSLGTMVSDILGGFGLRPDAVIGYSLGESVGLFSTRTWKSRDEMLRRIHRSPLFTRDLAGPCEAVRRSWGLAEGEAVDWAIGVLEAPAAAIEEKLEEKSRVYLLIVNTPGECVIGGDRAELEALVAETGARFHEVRGVTAVHCEAARPVIVPYRDLHIFETAPPEGVRFFSGVRGGDYDVDSASAADSIADQALYGFDFTKVVESAYASGLRVFLESGPGSSASRMISGILGDRPHLAVSACAPEHPPVAGMLRLLARLVADGIPFDLDALYGRPTAAAGHRDAEDPGPSLHLPMAGEPFERPGLGPRPEEADPAAKRSVTGRSEPAKPAPEPVPAPAARPVRPPIPRPEPDRREAAPAAPAGMGSPPPGTGFPGRAPKAGRSPSPEKAVPSPAAGLLDRFQSAEKAKAEAHERFLRFSQELSGVYSEALTHQMSLLAGGAVLPAPAAGPARPAEALPARRPPYTGPAPLLDRGACLRFAVGAVAEVLGPEYAEADSFPTRVRLPDEPLMLVDRIMEIEGEKRSMGSGRVVTEHDILPGAWYLDGGRIPTCIAVEAGQADLFLSGYLGIDSATKGLAKYRLLDAKVTFHRELPGPGETIRYDIRIDRFFRQDQTHLFRFRFEATVGGRPLLTMSEGCAGFFTDAELDAGKGIVHTGLDKRPLPGKKPAGWAPLVPMAAESFDDSRLAALRAGDLAGCFGPAFAGLPLSEPMTIPGGRVPAAHGGGIPSPEGTAGRMKLIDRVLRLDPAGGRFGLGQILAEADIHPGDWFLTCHFVDDMVMPGTLMYECCLHAFRVLLMRMGWVGESRGAAVEPVPGVTSQLRCRGQVIAATKKAAYEITLKEFGYREDGTPYAIADALMYSDGRPVVEMTDMSALLTGLTRESVEALWRSGRSAAPSGECRPMPAASISRPPIYDTGRILAFAVGKPSEAFGEPYKVFDEERVIARLPGPPFQFLDRVVELNAEPWKLQAAGPIEAQYDVPPDAWYFASDRQPRMPFAVLLETALQPCGWLAAYLGSALASETDLSFRNLGGKAVIHREVTPETGTLAARVSMTSVSTSGGMIIQHYDMETRDRAGLVYEGTTYFGFFSKAALADQVGLREAVPYQPSEQERERAESFPYPRQAPYPDDALRMLEVVDLFVPDGGPDGLGFIQGSIPVDPGAWFFKAHFYQDPVWPGSLGLESFQQLLKVVLVERWGAPAGGFESLALGEKHEWIYRGQVIPKDEKVIVSAVVTGVDEERRMLRADGFLSVDGRIIYQMKDFTLRGLR